MRQSHLIISNALIIWASRILLLVPQVILVPYLISTIGEAGYGVYVLIWSLLMGIDELEQSLQQGVVKYSAAFLAEGRINEVNRVISTSFIYSLLLGTLASVSIFTAAVWEGYTSNIGLSLFLVGGLVLFIVPITPYIAIIQSQQRYYVGVVADTISKYLSLAMIFTWFYLATPSVEALIVIMMVMLFASRFAQIPVAYHLVPGLLNRPEFFDCRIFKLIISFGGAVVSISLCNIANTTGVQWLMGIMFSTTFVAHLAIILMPSSLLCQIILAMTVTIMPATSAYEATGNDRMLRELLLRSMRYTTVIILAGVLVALFLVEDVLALWVGPNYTFLANYILAIFASVACVLTTSGAHHILKGLGKLQTIVFIALVGKVLVPLCLIFVVFTGSRNPYYAVIVGLVTGNVVWVIMHIVFIMKAIHVGFREIFTRVYAQALLVAAPLGVFALAMVNYSGIEGLLARTSVALLIVLIFFTLFYIFAATVEERQQVKEICRLLYKRFRALGWMHSRPGS